MVLWIDTVVPKVELTYSMLIPTVDSSNSAWYISYNKYLEFEILKKLNWRALKMMDLLTKINELAAKNKEIGLTSAELLQRDQLRQQYLQQIRGQVLANINSFTLIDEHGQDVTPEKIKDYKSNQFYF